ncbi:MAG: hypothetical protein NTW30_04900 [Candidatus Aenigmarchaeota archaeon]|nr:hypothetical protein [Candidatus Aenigmarchaeota archaeon]
MKNLTTNFMPPVAQQYSKKPELSSYEKNQKAVEMSIRKSSSINKGIEIAIAMCGAKKYSEEEMIEKIKYWIKQVDNFYDSPFL